MESSLLGNGTRLKTDGAGSEQETLLVRQTDEQYRQDAGKRFRLRTEVTTDQRGDDYLSVLSLRYSQQCSDLEKILPQNLFSHRVTANAAQA